MTVPDRLPAKTSDLLELALKDLEACEADPLFTIDMSRWCCYLGIDSPICAVCLAGAVIAKTLNEFPLSGLERYSGVTPSDLFRRDCISESELQALRELNFIRETLPDYVHDPVAFKDAARHRILSLRNAGR